MLSNILYILLAIVILGVIIVFHEFGHFIVGRLCGIGVVEFSVGFGPKLLGWKRKGTQFSLRAIPLGGFCKFVGEDESNSAPDAMNNASVWKRILTVFAGPAMNFLVAFLAGIAMLCLFYNADVYPVVNQVVDASAAQEAGLLPGDAILAANGAEIAQNSDGTQALSQQIAQGGEIRLTVRRGEETLEINASPKEVQNEDGSRSYLLGVVFQTRRFGFLEAIPASGRMMANVTGQLFDTLRKLIFHGEGADEMTGTVGTVVVISEVMQRDRGTIWDILFLISLNLGIMNLLPIPALDGGRLVFLIVEAIRGKPVPPEKEGMVHLIGFGLILILFVALTWHDIVNIPNLIKTIGGTP
ncbi:MAG: RIP metalloprotease RseP [Candidatus Faecivicinus sp.]|nr:RIP metalloprotease RseP [Candidatus Faecivicinus sp.]